MEPQKKIIVTFEVEVEEVPENWTDDYVSAYLDECYPGRWKSWKNAEEWRD